jgi:hypothetical protein
MMQRGAPGGRALPISKILMASKFHPNSNGKNSVAPEGGDF